MTFFPNEATFGCLEWGNLQYYLVHIDKAVGPSLYYLKVVAISYTNDAAFPKLEVVFHRVENLADLEENDLSGTDYNLILKVSLPL